MIHRLRAGFLTAVASVCVLTAAVSADTVFWDGEGGDLKWSTGTNFSDDQVPTGGGSGDEVIFNDTPSSDTLGDVTSIVDEDRTVKSLTFLNTTGHHHTLQINEGETLTVDYGGFTVGDNTSNVARSLTVKGAGSLVVNTSATTVPMRFRAGNNSTLTVDMSGLANFTVNSGHAEGSSSIGTGFGSNFDVRLAATNSITTTAFAVGASGGTGALHFGGTNAIHATLIHLGTGSAGTTLIGFDAGLAGTPTLTLRDKAGTGRTTFTAIGWLSANSANPHAATVDLTSAGGTGGAIDALLDQLVIGYRTHPSANGGVATGTLIYDQGVIDANTVRLGEHDAAVGSAINTTANGVITVAGSASLIADTILFGNDLRTSPTAGAVNGTLNLNGGTVRAAAMQPGAGTGTRIVNFTSGTIGNKTGQDLTIDAALMVNLNGLGVHAFDAETGRAVTVDAAINGDGGLTKTGQGTLVINSSSGYTGATTVTAGTMIVNGALSGTTSVTVENGATLGGSGNINPAATVTVQNGGALAPGNSPGVLNTGSVTLQSGGSLVIEINGPNAGSDYDQLAVTGGVNLSGATLVVTLGYVPALHQTFTLISNDSDDPITGKFAFANGYHAGGDTFTLFHNGQPYGVRLYYDGEGLATSGGNDLVLEVYALPEPAGLAIMGVAMAWPLRRPRRRSRSRN